MFLFPPRLFRDIFVLYKAILLILIFHIFCFDPLLILSRVATFGFIIRISLCDALSDGGLRLQASALSFLFLKDSRERLRGPLHLVCGPADVAGSKE